MQYLFMMQVSASKDYLTENKHDIVFAQFLPRGYQLLKGIVFAVLHHQNELLIINLDSFNDLDDIGVINKLHQVVLIHENLFSYLVEYFSCKILWIIFSRFDLINLTRSPGTYLLNNLVSLLEVLLGF